MKQIHRGFWTERRGKRVVGFCDKGCKLETGTGIFRDKQWQVVAAMNRHIASVHEGVTQLEIDYENISPVNPDGSFRF